VLDLMLERQRRRREARFTARRRTIPHTHLTCGPS
jgi:hypothetical protein